MKSRPHFHPSPFYLCWSEAYSIRPWLHSGHVCIQQGGLSKSFYHLWKVKDGYYILHRKKPLTFYVWFNFIWWTCCEFAFYPKEALVVVLLARSANKVTTRQIAEDGAWPKLTCRLRAVPTQYREASVSYRRCHVGNFNCVCDLTFGWTSRKSSKLREHRMI